MTTQTTNAVLIWTDNPVACVPLRDEFRRKADEEGRKTRYMIRDATVFTSDIEPCDTIVFAGANRRDEIVAAYRQDWYRDKFGDIPVIDVLLGNFGEPVEVPDLGPDETPVEETAEPDLLDLQLEARSDDDLRAMIFAATGKKPHGNVQRNRLLKMARDAQTGDDVAKIHTVSDPLS